MKAIEIIMGVPTGLIELTLRKWPPYHRNTKGQKLVRRKVPLPRTVRWVSLPPHNFEREFTLTVKAGKPNWRGRVIKGHYNHKSGHLWWTDARRIHAKASGLCYYHKRVSYWPWEIVYVLRLELPDDAQYVMKIRSETVTKQLTNERLRTLWQGTRAEG